MFRVSLTGLALCFFFFLFLKALGLFPTNQPVSICAEYAFVLDILVPG